jgi:hypothetical protein
MASVIQAYSHVLSKQAHLQTPVERTIHQGSNQARKWDACLRVTYEIPALLFIHLLGPLLLTRIKDKAPNHSACLHLGKHLSELRQPDHLKRRLNKAARKEGHSLGRVLPVAYVRPLNAHHTYDRIKHGYTKLGPRRQRDKHHGSVGPDVRRRLLERPLLRRQQQDGVRTQPLGPARLLYLLDYVPARGKVDVVLRP